MSETSIDYEILSQDGEKYLFKSVTDLKNWLKTEIEVWQECQKKIAEHIQSLQKGNTRHTWNQLTTDFGIYQLKPLDDIFVSLENTPSIPDAIKKFNKSGCLISKSAKGKKALDLSVKDIEISFLLSLIWNKNSKAEHIILNDPAAKSQDSIVVFQKLYSKANIEIYLFENGFPNTNEFKSAAKTESESIKTIKNKIQEYLADTHLLLEDYKKKNTAQEDLINKTKKEFDALIKKSNENFDKLAQEQDTTTKKNIADCLEEIAKIKKYFSEELALKIPVSYWSKKSVDHREAAYFWATLFIGLVWVTISESPDILENILAASIKTLPNIEKSQLALFFILTFPAFLVIWILRLIARNIITNFNNMHDSKTRAVMTQTFLALMNEGKANENDRILILSALFQPMHSQSEDGSPPHWFELMMERIKNK